MTRFEPSDLLGTAKGLYADHFALCKHCLSGQSCSTEQHIADDIRRLERK